MSSCCQQHHHSCHEGHASCHEDFLGLSLSLGDKVPSFKRAIYSNAEKKISEWNYTPLRWTVLIFYPADFTPVCHSELSSLVELQKVFQEREIDLFSVSVDTAYVHEAWSKSEGFPGGATFPMVADVRADLAQMFGVYNEEEGLARRATVIIDPEGIFSGLELVLNSVGRSSHELLRKMEAYIFSRESGQACLANWSKK